MIRNKEIMVDEIWYRYHLACELEAIVMGLPPDAGTHIFLGILIDFFEDWDDEDFQVWLELMKKEFGKDVLWLYLECSKLFNSYRELKERTIP